MRYTPAVRSRSSRMVAAVFVLFLAGLGGADYFLKELPALRALEELRAEQVDTQMPEQPTGQPVKKGVSRKPGPNVKELLVETGYTWTEVGGNERSLLGDAWNEPIQMITVLRNGDRTAMLAWADSPDIKDAYLALKRGLETSFSGDVTNLVDESLTPEVGAPRDILSFRDPAIGPERVVFARIRTRLYEFHVRDGHEEEVVALVERLAE